MRPFTKGLVELWAFSLGLNNLFLGVAFANIIYVNT
jgi:hypothetical protein